MDKALDFGSEDCRFESCQGRNLLGTACSIIQEAMGFPKWHRSFGKSRFYQSTAFTCLLIYLKSLKTRGLVA
ncbi:unnamed protein product [Anisakis simplex]|uniref:Uncharacterized protein n=1 Tax=Anisakis simplex TaxID=6269 RepID=A0A0M3K4J0_ANISI|nr:unnamed protein product [Anisakis simplex]